MTSNPVKYCFSGAWTPKNGNKIVPGQETFSVGVYPRLPKVGGGEKKGKVVTRVYGVVDCPERCENLAQRIVDALGSGAIQVEHLKKRYYAYANDYDDFERNHGIARQ